MFAHGPMYHDAAACKTAALPWPRLRRSSSRWSSSARTQGDGNGGTAKADISIYGQESNYTTWRLVR